MSWLTRWNRGDQDNDPNNPMAQLQRDINRAFGHFFGGDQGVTAPFGREQGFMPTIDMRETNEDYRVEADLPGMSKDNVEVNLTDTALIISGEKVDESEEESDNYYRSERRFGQFRRSIPLPDGIDRDKVAATFENGVLSVSLPKTSKARKGGRKITVK